MKLEQLAVTLDTAKKLRAAGFPQDTPLEWREVNGTWRVITDGDVPGGIAMISHERIAAPTATDLLDALPSQVRRGSSLYVLNLPCGGKCGAPTYCDYTTPGEHIGADEPEWSGPPALVERLALLYLVVSTAGLIPTGEAARG